MPINVISIGSSSSGNSYYVRAGSTAILVDAGLAAKKITSAITDAGDDPCNVRAVLITHEHTDHVKSIRAISRKCPNAEFYSSRGTIESAENFKYVPDERISVVCAGDAASLSSDVTVRVFALSHDAKEPVGYSIEHCPCDGSRTKLAIITDTGIVTDEIFEAALDADMLVFEANHDEDLLMYGEYPYPVKMRIKSDYGHLSNRCAGEVLARIINERKSKREAESFDYRPLSIMLAHLSFHNNAPFYARNTIESILKEKGCREGIDYTLTIAAKDEICTLSDSQASGNTR